MYRNYRRIHTAVLALFIAATASAQGTPKADSTQDAPKTWETGAVQVHAGVARYGIGTLNSALSRSNRPTFSTTSGTLGLNAYARFGRVLLGAGVESSIGNRQVADGWMTRLSTEAATLDAGVVILSARNTVIYSMASIGARHLGLRFERQGDFSYQDALDDPSRGVTLSSLNALTRIGLTVEQHLMAPRLGMLSLGVQSGIATPIGSSSTIAGEQHVSGTPGQQSGTYLRFSIGKPIGRRSDAFGAVTAALLSVIGR